MASDIYIFSDESEKEGTYFANFYAGALVVGSDLAEIEAVLNARKRDLHLDHEIKWQRVTANYLSKYIEMVDAFFDLVEAGKIKVRVMFTHRHMTPPPLSSYHRVNSYWFLYYQFIKHAFGLAHAPLESRPRHLRLCLDVLPDSGESRRVFKEILLGLNRSFGGRFRLLAEHITEVNSHEHVVMQCLDVVLGAMQFRLNDKHLEKPKGATRRGKRTIAKEKLYKHINARIQRAHGSMFNIGVSTGQPNGAADRWAQPYRHWVFETTGSTRDPSRVKRRK